MSLFESHLIKLNLPAALAEEVTEFLSEFAGREPVIWGDVCHAGLGESFVKTAAVSEYFQKNCLKWPHFIATLLQCGGLRTAGVDADGLSEKHDHADGCLNGLREFRHLQMMRILWRECGDIGSVEETLIDLSDLADILIRAAVRASHTAMVAKYGLPAGEFEPDQLIVVAMGKLGGGELNVSSDVDLVFLHSHRGETAGPTKVEHQEFFSRQTRKAIDLLTRPTSAGIVYRVDTRLRPFGNSGKPCVGLNALEQYLSLHGREWERYAYIKHRPVMATDHQSAELQSILRPFVYRKYLDFGVFEGLREMKALIESEIARKDMLHDIKRGAGGIRQIEFIVQTLQLVYGGKQQSLQTSSLYQALKALCRAGYISREDRDQLHDDYNFLRRLENGLQAARDQQVHKLPTAEMDRARLAVLMNLSSWSALDLQIREVRERVQRRFNALSVDPAGASDAVKQSSAERLWQQSVTADSVNESDDEHHTVLSELLSIMRPLGTDGLRDRLDSTGRTRLDCLMPAVLQRLAVTPERDTVAPLMMHVIEGIGRRSAYFAMLIENPSALDRVLSICTHSPKLARQLAASPMLLDTLVDPRGSSIHLTRAGLKSRFDQQFGHLDPLDDERCLHALCEFRQSAVFEVALADMENQLPIMKVSDRLTEIAELILSEAIRMAKGQMQHRYGVPRHASDATCEAEFAVVGYGKLGGLELAYSSDLDLVFLYDDGGTGCTDGEDSLDNAVYFSRLAQRLIHILTIPTAFGALFEVDMRLRPSGRSGALVSRLSAFARYQQTQAWTWEQQALLRARGVGGDAGLIRRFEDLRREIIHSTRDVTVLREDVFKMRAKMKRNLDRSKAGHFDLKHGPGGLTDLEFLVQYLVLKHAQNDVALAHFSDNIRQLEALKKAAVLGESDGAELQRIYLLFRQHIHRRALSGHNALISSDKYIQERNFICAALGAHQLM